PQESLSSAGSYRPCASGMPGSTVDPRPMNPALHFSSLISSCLAGATNAPACSLHPRGHGARSQRVTDLEKGQPVRLIAARGRPLSAPTDASPTCRPPPSPPFIRTTLLP